MIKWLTGKISSAFSKRYDYDTQYMDEIAEVNPSAMTKYLLMMPLAAHRKHAPVDAYFIAKVVATQFADCGPCLRLCYNMAVEAGIAEATLAEILRGELNNCSENAQLAHRYTTAVVNGDLLTVSELGELAESRWGKDGLSEVALAIGFGMFFPNFKRAFGHAESCDPVLAELTRA